MNMHAMLYKYAPLHILLPSSFKCETHRYYTFVVARELRTRSLGLVLHRFRHWRVPLHPSSWHVTVIVHRRNRSCDHTLHLHTEIIHSKNKYTYIYIHTCCMCMCMYVVVSRHSCTHSCGSSAPSFCTYSCTMASSRCGESDPDSE